jgi:hypothetical protein
MISTLHFNLYLLYKKKKNRKCGKALEANSCEERPFRGSEDTRIQQNKHGWETTKRLITNDR